MAGDAICLCYLLSIKFQKWFCLIIIEKKAFKKRDIRMYSFKKNKKRDEQINLENFEQFTSLKFYYCDLEYFRLWEEALNGFPVFIG